MGRPKKIKTREEGTIYQSCMPNREETVSEEISKKENLDLKKCPVCGKFYAIRQIVTLSKHNHCWYCGERVNGDMQ